MIKNKLIMKNFLFSALLLSICSINCLKQDEYQNRLINSINTINSANTVSKIDLNQNFNSYELIRNSLEDYIGKLDLAPSALPNVTQHCLIQLLAFVPALQKKETWTFSCDLLIYSILFFLIALFYIIDQSNI